MRREHMTRLIAILVLAALALVSVLVHEFTVPVLGHKGRSDTPLGISLGLDLQGGVHLVYEADTSNIGPDESEEAAVAGALDIVERRVNKYGVTEPLIQLQGSNRIAVQLPGIRDINEAVRLIGETAELDFREILRDENGIPVLDEEGNEQWVPAMARDSAGNDVHLTGKYLKRNNRRDIDPDTGEPVVAFEFDKEGANLFEQITERLLEKPLGIFLDDELISAPTVRAVISDRGVIEGIDYDRAGVLAIQLNEGALPLPLNLMLREDVDATLGADSLRKSLVAGIIGLALVLAFMILHYRLPGVLASSALIIYAIFILCAFKLIPVVLTLAGIAAFILSVGMAVDANILIFERLKEELRAGKTLRAAVESGFNRAWPSIRDSNVSTFITCGILYWLGNVFGEPRVMGFALTLGVGVAISMFTAIVVTRTLLRSVVGTALGRRLSWFVDVREAGSGR